METQHRRLMAIFPRSDVLEIEYEEINTSLQRVVRRLRKYLGVPQNDFDVPFEKATPDDLRLAISNFSEIKKHLLDTPYDAQLDP
jgi:hypothetical protein